MSNFAKNCTSTVIPALRYRDAPAAIEWLCRALGFEKHAIYPNADGTIAHAQLTLGNGMVMLSSITDSDHGKLMIHPSEVGQRNTQTTCLIVTDADAVYALSRVAGAEIVMNLQDQSYGGRAFSCRDPEGHLWSIGTYDPWA